MPCEASSGKYPMHDGATTMRWNQANPRPLPSWTAPERAKHEWLIREAFKLANQAVDNGNCPYAGLLATAVNADGSGGEIKLRHCNGVHGKDGPNQHTRGHPDLTDHGEAGAIRAACAAMSLEELSTLTFYTSTEACAMCSTAIFWAGCPTIVYGCPAPARGALATLPQYKESESPYCGNYGAMSAPAPSGGRGVDIWRILDGIPNTAGKVREVIGPLLPEEGMDT